MKHILILTALLAMTACSKDETVAGYGASDKVWRLQSIDERAMVPRVTLVFGENGEMSGQAPCNRWFGQQTAPYPWFAPGAIGSTKMACPNLDAEGAFFQALGDMTLAEVSGDVLILSNDDGRKMIFEAEAPIEDATES